MKVGIIGSRGLSVKNLDTYLPADTDTVISGGARGIDSCAASFAQKKGLALIEFLPEYDKYGRSAPLRRNITIIDNSDLVLAFWDLKSRGTAFVIKKCKERNVPVKVFTPSAEQPEIYIPYNDSLL